MKRLPALLLTLTALLAMHAPAKEKAKDLFALPANVRIIEAERNLGEIPLDTRATYAFRVENDGPGILEILFVQAPFIPEDRDATESFDRFVMPGQSGEVKILLDTRFWNPGPFKATYALVTNQKGPRPVIVLHGVLRAFLRMHPEPSSLHFETGRGFSPHRSFVLHAEGRPGFKVTDIETDLPILWETRVAERATRVETNWPQLPETWARRGDVILKMKLSPEASVGYYAPKDVVIKTDIPGHNGYRFHAAATVRDTPGPRPTSPDVEWKEE